MTMVDFVCAEYRDGKAYGDEDLSKYGLQKLEFAKARVPQTIDSKTITLTSHGEKVKPDKLNHIYQW